MAIEVGLTNRREGRGLAKFDFDGISSVHARMSDIMNLLRVNAGDGDEDVVVSHLIGKPSLFENLGGNRNSWLRVRVMHR